MALLAVLSGCVAVDLTNKSVFAGLTYGGDDRPVPSVQLEFQLYAHLQFDVAGPWNNPQAAAQCLASLSAADLERIGRATTGTLDATTWAATLTSELTALRATPACTAGFGADPSQLAWSIGKAASTTFDFAQLTWLAPARKADTYVAAASALKRLGTLLAATPSNQAAQNHLPVLALSGGAANGAFSAGVLYELLSTREEALARMPVAQRPALDLATRFSSVVGTSVGALLGQLLEFAMIDEGTLTPAQLDFVTQCNAYQLRPEVPHGNLSGGKMGCFSGWPGAPFPSNPVPSARPVQACALKLLQRYFADVDEADLMCAEAGSVARALDVLGRPRVNFIRFDPMQARPLDPLLALFHERMRDNRLTRVVVAVETQQNQLVGLDERACTGADPAACLGSGLMASLVLPFFARPVSHTWSGFETGGECGLWVDGGLRSQQPALRALMYSRGTPLLPAGSAPLRVLALDTGRLTPIPAPKPGLITESAFNTLEQYATQQALNELAFAPREAQLRDLELAALEKLRDPASAAAVATDARVRGLYVPSDVQDWVVAGAGYSFDRYVMRGLFLWGQQVARAQLGEGGDLATKLGWPAPMPDQVKALITEHQGDAAFQQWLADYQQPLCPDFARWRLEEGARRVNDTMPLCAAPEDGPKYFTCPAGTWSAGATP